jgi:hypothetical protein
VQFSNNSSCESVKVVEAEEEPRRRNSVFYETKAPVLSAFPASVCRKKSLRGESFQAQVAEGRRENFSRSLGTVTATRGTVFSVESFHAI